MEDEYTLDDALARLAADEDQNAANLTSLGYQIGTFYKSLRRNGVPRKLAMDLVGEFFAATMSMTAITAMIEQDGDSN